jgi:hypothetical protein
VKQIEVFGEPSEAALGRLREKARMLGDATLPLRPVDAGFGRVSTPHTQAGRI